MAKKKKQTIGYKYFASAHFVLCHGPIDAITKISFQDKDAYLAEENTNKTIYINKPSLFGGDEQSGGIQGNIELLFGRSDQQKSSTLQRICAKISNAFGGLISAYRGVCSVVFDNVYIGTAPNMPDSKWRVKRIHTRHDGQVQWYDEKAEINTKQYLFKPEDTIWKYKSVSASDSADYTDVDKSLWNSGASPFGDKFFAGPGHYGFPTSPATVIEQQTILWAETFVDIDSLNQSFLFECFLDNGITVWVNGILTLSDYNVNAHYYSKELSASFFKLGSNRITIKCIDDGFGERPGNWIWFDLRLKNRSMKEADINPAHIIRECLTNQVWGVGVSESNIDDASFRHAADTLYDEQMGMSIKWTDSTSINEFVDNIKEHINAQLYLDRVTNKWKLYLIRDDYDDVNLILLDESNIRNLDFERRTLAECVNSVTVTYWDRERAKDSTVTVQDIARIAQQGGVISQSVDYKGFTNSDLASRVSLRDLKTLSSTLASVSFDVDESFSENWHEGMPFKLSDESYGLSEAVMRIRTIKRGDGINNTVYVEAIEDSFSSPMQSVVEYVPPITSGDSTAKNATAIAFEVPYIELVEQYGQDEVDAKLSNYPELGYVGMAAIRPNNQHVNASLYVDAGAGYDERTTLDFCPSASLKNDIGYMDSSFELENVAEFELLDVNHRIQVNDEIMAFVSFNAVTNVVNVKRGCFDTVPQKHDAGSKVFGWDNYSGLDDLEYLSGENVSLKALTLTGSDVLDVSEATAHDLTCAARAIRPYPPANVKINGEYWPVDIETDLILTWVDRNRIQQTGGEILGWYEGSVTLESGTTYIISIYAFDYSNNSETLLLTQNVGVVNSHTIDISNITTDAIKVKISSERDGFLSFQSFEHVLSLRETRITESGETRVTEAGEILII
ncbi:hypothetical protein BEN71_10200 [Acinetobacter wuhouensis]|uniref:phage tail protein n=1 Tax=Acinetobacter wuhouensis TaxID=1879050 RepID=UPI00083B4214|nr:phage tail protein [Acinetobacter wuhouensis]AXQ21839.1 hypothetical protein BEN71_07080 [Acinetobacter wuhouensis]AXQ22424.1 hypothetical protein BEN71_10200 [Acinetobacter wuhouensis]